MSDNSNIEWLLGGATWNPLRARITDQLTGEVRLGWHCERISAGCGQHYGKDQKGGCYAEQQNKGFFNLGTRLPYTRQSRDKVEIFLDEETLLQPLHWRKPRMIFPCSMTDWAGAWVPDGWMDKMLAVAALCPQHTFLFLTKRADRLRDYLKTISDSPMTRLAEDIALQAGRFSFLAGMPRSFADEFARRLDPDNGGWPLKNVWIGVSVEDQKTTDERIPLLIQTPAALRWLSCEPLIGPVEIATWLWSAMTDRRRCAVDWIVLGGESGPRARPFNLEWGRDIIGQAKAARVPVFVKQLGAVPLFAESEWRARNPFPLLNARNHDHAPPGSGFVPLYLANKKGGDISEWPADLRVRQFPEVANA